MIRVLRGLWIPPFLLALLLFSGLIDGVATSQIVRLPHADTTRGNYFGAAVALHGNRAIVGASAEDSCGENGGAAYIFVRNDTTRYWQKEARLVPENCESGLSFGRQVDIHGDFAMVASNRDYFATAKPNIVYCFRRDSSGTWHEFQRLTINSEADEGPFGFALTLGERLAVITTAGDVAQSQHSGAAYVYELEQGVRWVNTTRLFSSHGTRHGIFGGDVALVDREIAVAASGYFNRRPGSVHIFALNEAGLWSEEEHIHDVEDIFVALDSDQHELLIGQARGGRSRSGLATLYVKDSTGTWQLTASLKPPTPYSEGGFGTEVALSGDRALVVGYDEQLRLNYNVDRVVYVFRRQDDQWSYQGIIDIGEFAFASSMDLDGAYALIGASSSEAPGAAYVIRIP